MKVLATQNAPGAIGPYVQGIALETPAALVFTSGQLGLDPVTGELPAGVEAQTHQSLKNLQAILAQGGLDFSNVVKTTVFVKDLADFATVNSIYATYFTTGKPARSCVQVAALPKDALIEIECIAAR